ncbi:MAG TPA: trigger factor [Candidatus Binataceae bacterium]|nr:trigger factor [Candidatus Binataceae bacterium]
MNVNIETTSALRRKLTIELEPAEVNRELDRAYNDLKRSVQLKGFRPGHAPRALLERFFGDQVRGDVIQKLVKEYTGRALDENDLKPVVEPEIVTEESDLKKAQLRFTATFDLKPALVVRDYEGLKVPKAKIEVNESEVDAALERLRERHATLKKVEGREVVEEGDFVVASFEGFEDGKPIAETKMEDRLVQVAANVLAHGLDEVLRGAHISVEARKSRSYPADYAEKDIAGKNVEWRATVKEIFTRVLPDIDDEFAKDQGQYQNLTELRAAVREGLERQAQQEADARARQGLLDLILERNPVEVPESLTAREQRTLEAETVMALESAGVPREAALDRARQNPEDVKARAEKRAKSGLIVDAIAEQEKVEVSDDEVADRVAAIVTQSGRQRERAAEFYGHEENRVALKISMKREKTLDLLLTRAQSESATEGEAPAGEAPSGA